MLSDPAIYGPAIQTFVIVGSIIGFIYNIKNDLNSVKGEVGNLRDAQKTLNEAFTQLGRILTQVAVQDSRLNMFEKRLDELVHGQG